jgi:hypothetical protein
VVLEKSVGLGARCACGNNPFIGRFTDPESIATIKRGFKALQEAGGPVLVSNFDEDHPTPEEQE